VRHRHAISILAVFLLNAGFSPRIEAQSDTRADLALGESQRGAFEGQKIVNIAFDPVLQPLEGRELFELLTVKKDGVYRAADVRTSIEKLYATGRYQDIQVDVTPDAGGLLMRFQTKNNWFIGEVSVETDLGEPPSPGQIVSATRLQLGDPFDSLQVPAALENVRKLLIDNGFFDPRIEPEFIYRDHADQVDIVIGIKAGKRGRYETPSISGNTSLDAGVTTKEDAGVTTKDIIKATHWRRFILPGYRGVTLSRTRSGIDDVRLRYEKANRLLATVVLSSMDNDVSRNVAEPKISVDPGRWSRSPRPAPKSPKSNCGRMCRSMKSTQWTQICLRKGR